MESKKDSYFRYYRPFNVILGAYFERHVTGVENIPQDEPVIVVANHVSFWDSPLLAAAYTQATNKPLRLVAQKEYFDGDGVRIKKDEYDEDGRQISKERRIGGSAIKHFVEATRMIPVDRNTTKDSLVAFNRTVGETLQFGDSVGIHGEGTRSRDGRMNNLRDGFARIAVDNHVSIVPAGVSYHDSDSWHPKAANIAFGEPLTYHDYNSGMFRLLPTGPKVKLMSEILTQRIAKLSQQERSHKKAII